MAGSSRSACASVRAAGAGLTCVRAASPEPSTPAGVEGQGEPERAQARPTPAALTEAQALRELPAIPLHFASSYILVKPYVDGFESNLLDAPSLKHVRINRDWRPPAAEQPGRVARAAKR